MVSNRDDILDRLFEGYIQPRPFYFLFPINQSINQSTLNKDYIKFKGKRTDDAFVF